MDEQELMALVEQYLRQQHGGGTYQPPQYGGDFFFPPDGAKVPNYRTQYTPFISDGNVPLSQALGKTADKFSFDAFMGADPALKSVLAPAISENKHDPIGTLASFGEPKYQFALIQKILGDMGLEQVDPTQIMHTDARGVDQYANPEDIINAMSKKWGERYNTTRKGGDEPLPGLGYRPGKVTGRTEKYSDVLRQRLKDIGAQVDDFVSQAGPSMGRNINNIDFAWQRLGGMPYPGINADTLDYRGSGPGFTPPARKKPYSGSGPRRAYVPPSQR